MQTDTKIGLICIYGGRPLDIILPVISENDITERYKNQGHCFHVYDLTYTELYLFSKSADGIKHTAKIDIRSSCKPDSDISLHIVKMNDGRLFLSSYIDSNYNGLYPIPAQLY